MKKLILAIISTGITLSLNTYAFTSECNTCGYNGGLCAPKYQGGFYLGLTGAWLQPSASDVGLNDLDLDRTSPNSNRSQVLKFDPDYKWAWGANAGYDLPCSAYDLEASYFHLENNSHSNSNTGDNADFLSSFFIINFGFPVGTPADATLADPIIILDYDSRSRLEFKFNQADIKFGRQYNDVCGHFQLKPSIGVRYANIKETYFSSFRANLFNSLGLGFPGIPTFVSSSSEGQMFSRFHGVGPMFSLDARYGFCGGIGIVGHFNASLLVGKIHSGNISNFTFQPTTPAGVPVGEAVNGSSGCDIPESTRTVRNFDGKLGVDYSYCFCNKSSLTLEAGYQASSYSDAVDFLQSRASTPSILLPADLNPRNHGTASTISNDFEFQGPYLNITWHI